MDELLFVKFGGGLSPAFLSVISPFACDYLEATDSFVRLSSIPPAERGTRLVEWLRLHRLGDFNAILRPVAD